MSLAALSLRCQQCHTAMRLLPLPISRQFHSGPILLARQTKKITTPTKKQLAEKAKRRAAKAQKSIYESEKMKLDDAIAVLRAVEVASPNATYEITIKTEMPNGAAVPKGRYTLPREPKAASKDKILVFAEGRQAGEAKAAGADIVGGPELVDGILSGRHQATLFLCTPGLIRGISSKLGRFLGPRGLMPSERRGTVTDDISGFIRRLKGTAEWRGDKAGTIRAPIAKLEYPVEDVVKNIRYFLRTVKIATGNQRDPTDTGRKKDNQPVNPITKVILSSRQGPGIQIADF